MKMLEWKWERRCAQISGAGIPVNKGYTRHDDDEVMADIHNGSCGPEIQRCLHDIIRENLAK
jgi:hypothetical protein